MSYAASAREKGDLEAGHQSFVDHLRGLVEEHERALVQCELTFDDPTDATRWDAETDAVQLALGDAAHRASSDELRISFADTMGSAALTRNPFLFRIMLTFASMVGEMQSLTREAADTFMPALAVYDELDDASSDEDEAVDTEGNGARSESPMATGRGWREAAAGVGTRREAIRRTSRSLSGFMHFLRILQRIWTWQNHVQRVTRYAVQQLSALYGDANTELRGARSRNGQHGGRGEARSAAHWCRHFFAESRMHLVWSALGDMLCAVLTLDEMVVQNAALSRGLAAMHDALALMECDKDVLWVDDRQEPSLRELIRTVEQDVMGGNMLRRAVQQAFDSPHEGIAVTTNTGLQKELIAVLHQQLNAVDEACGTAREVENEARYCSALALHYLLICLFQPSRSTPASELLLQRRTLTKRVFDFRARIPLIHLHGLYAVFPGVWMTTHHRDSALPSPEALEEVERATVRTACEHCRRRDSALTATVRRLTTLTATWIAAMQATQPVESPHARAFVQETALLLQRGLGLTRDLQHTLVYLLLTHHHTNTPVTLSTVDAIAYGVQLLVQVRQAFHNKTGIIAAAFTTLIKSVTLTMEHHLCAIAASIYPALASQGEPRRASGRAADPSADALRYQYDAILQAIHLVQRTSVPTEDNLTCLSLSLDLAFNRLRLQTAQSGATLVDSRAVDEIFAALSQLQRLTEYQRRVALTTDCTFLFWQRHTLLPLFFRGLYHQTQGAGQLPAMVVALQDAEDTLLAAAHVGRPLRLCHAYEDFVRQCLWAELVNPLCTDVENDLRLGSHTAVLGQPFRRLSSVDDAASSAPSAVAVKNLVAFTQLAPFRFFGCWLHLRAVVEDYLDAQFYNLNALMPNDWETYEEMRQCAREWYGLTLCDSHLPGSVMDQGLDVLAITENIQVFIAHYTYNLNEQLFVQRPSSTTLKHLHTLHTCHIANSIRTHGTGIMNTAVNYVYKCLVRKLTIVSQFLYDDVVRSRLLRDATFVKSQKTKGGVVYPLAHAEGFVQEMARIGLSENGKTYLDKFRELVAEVGNALGYMRLVRSGGLRAVADAAVFVPSGGHHRTKTYSDDGEGEGDDEHRASPPSGSLQTNGSPSDPCRDALAIVDDVTEDMRVKLSGGSEYYRLLLRSVGAKLRKDDKYQYLRLFHLMVPPMTLSFVDYLVKEKGKLTKQRKEGVFCDDGFALGCAFLMALFDVESAFDALHWFPHMRQHYLEKLESIQREMVESVECGRRSASTATAGYTDNEEARVHNMYLSLSVVDVFYKEFIGLEEAFLSSKILFYDPSTTGAPNASQEEGSEEADKTATPAAV